MPRNVPKRNGSRRTPRHPTSFSRSAGSHGLTYILFVPAVVEMYVEIPNRHSESRARFPATFAMTRGCWEMLTAARTARLRNARHEPHSRNHSRGELPLSVRPSSFRQIGTPESVADMMSGGRRPIVSSLP